MNNELRINKKRGVSGFTLVETLIYSAITVMMLVFAIFTVYNMISASNKVRSQKELSEGKKFLEQKIYWTLQSISAINSPAPGATSTSLSVTKLNYANNPVVIDNPDWIARIKKGSGNAIPITGDYVSLKDLNFHQFTFSGRPAIYTSGTMTDIYSSTSVDIDFTIIAQ
ncbi:MAG: hypothetical protein Q8L24_02965 [bacterium]|nr:hypothetical protein [bacterium]